VVGQFINKSSDVSFLLPFQWFCYECVFTDRSKEREQFKQNIGRDANTPKFKEYESYQLPWHENKSVRYKQGKELL